MRLDQPPAFRLLSGYGAPGAGSGLDPLNGVNDPWRWHSALHAWVSDPVPVSFSTGATIAAYAAPTAGNLHVVVGVGTNPLDIENQLLIPATSNAVSWNGTSMDRPASASVTATSGGSGTAYLFWNLSAELDDPGTSYTNTSADTLPTETRTVADLLGADFTVGSTGTWSEDAVGNIDDFYLDLDSYTGDLWGPRANDTWGGIPAFQITRVLTAPDGSLHRIEVANDGTLSTIPI